MTRTFSSLMTVFPHPDLVCSRLGKAAKRTAELHTDAAGGPGFGMAKHNRPTDGWIERFWRLAALPEAHEVSVPTTGCGST